MRRPRRQPALVEAGLMAHMRAAVWGPAEFVGMPPRLLIGEGLFVGLLGTGAIIGVGALGIWAAPPVLRSGEAGIAVACVVALYLCAIRAGRALVGIVALLGVCLALLTPQAASGLALAYRGQEQQVVVTSVESAGEGAAGRSRYLCSVEDRDGVPLSRRIWRGCLASTEPGDALAVVYDPSGRVETRGVEGPQAEQKPLMKLAALSLALIAGCVLAVVRSFRLSVPPQESPVLPGAPGRTDGASS